jgi:hypothetical protein
MADLFHAISLFRIEVLTMFIQLLAAAKRNGVDSVVGAEVLQCIPE